MIRPLQGSVFSCHFGRYTYLDSQCHYEHRSHPQTFSGWSPELFRRVAPPPDGLQLASWRKFPFCVQRHPTRNPRCIVIQAQLLDTPPSGCRGEDQSQGTCRISPAAFIPITTYEDATYSFWYVSEDRKLVSHRRVSTPANKICVVECRHRNLLFRPFSRVPCCRSMAGHLSSNASTANARSFVLALHISIKQIAGCGRV
jgi:hypothetical protein